jgi:hypothetical protein
MTDLNQTANVLSDIVNLDEPKKILCITFKHGESVSLLNGLIELDFDLKHHSNRVLVRFKAPKFVQIFRKKKEQTND